MRLSRLLQLSLVPAMSFGVVAMPGLPLPGIDSPWLAGTASAQPAMGVDTFYDQLSPYGDWVENPEYGYVWVPQQVSAGWRPYTVGQWIDTDQGWYWDSPEPFAWAVYHYGRWAYDDYYGWYWVPGDVWAPAWVQWRYGSQYVGWAPVGPQRAGYAYGVPDQWEPPIAESWVFVQPRYMVSPQPAQFALSIGNLGIAFGDARQVYRPAYRDGRMYNYGVPPTFIGQRVGRPVVRVNIFLGDKYYGGKNRYQQRDKGGIHIYAPGIKKGDGHGYRPKHVYNGNDFKPKAKLKENYKGNVPKGWGPKAADVKPSWKGKGGDKGGWDKNDGPGNKDGKNGSGGPDKKGGWDKNGAGDNEKGNLDNKGDNGKSDNKGSGDNKKNNSDKKPNDKGWDGKKGGWQTYDRPGDKPDQKGGKNKAGSDGKDGGSSPTLTAPDAKSGGGGGGGQGGGDKKSKSGGEGKSPNSQPKTFSKPPSDSGGDKSGTPPTQFKPAKPKQKQGGDGQGGGGGGQGSKQGGQGGGQGGQIKGKSMSPDQGGGGQGGGGGKKDDNKKKKNKDQEGAGAE